MLRQHHSDATTPCLNYCRSASCISRARESRTISPIRRNASASQFGNSAARERRPAIFHTTELELHRRNSASFRLHIQTCAVVVVEGATIPLCIWSHHHARPWTSPELRWHWLVLLADLHAGSIRF